MTAGLTLLVGTIAAAGPVMAQDTTRNGVHIGLNYQPGTKPGVLVLPISGPGGDSAHTIIQRDLDFADAMNVITGIDQEMGDAAVNFALVEKLGAAAVVQASLAPASLHVTVYDVAKRRVLLARDFALPATPGAAGLADGDPRCVGLDPAGHHGVARHRGDPDRFHPGWADLHHRHRWRGHAAGHAEGWGAALTAVASEPDVI